MLPTSKVRNSKGRLCSSAKKNQAHVPDYVAQALQDLLK